MAETWNVKGKADLVSQIIQELKYETTTGHDWMTFVAKMKELHGIEVPVLEFTPLRLRGAHGIYA